MASKIEVSLIDEFHVTHCLIYYARQPYFLEAKTETATGGVL